MLCAARPRRRGAWPAGARFPAPRACAAPGARPSGAGAAPACGAARPAAVPCSRASAASARRGPRSAQRAARSCTPSRVSGLSAPRVGALVQRLLQVRVARRPGPAAPARFRRPAGAPARAPAALAAGWRVERCQRALLRQRGLRPPCGRARSGRPAVARSHRAGRACSARSFCCMRQRSAWRGSENKADSARSASVQEHESRRTGSSSTRLSDRSTR